MSKQDNVTMADFIRAWCNAFNEGTGVRGVAVELYGDGLSEDEMAKKINTLQTRATGYRKGTDNRAPIHLPHFSGGRTNQTLDTDAANKQIADALGISVDELKAKAEARKSEAKSEGGEVAQ